MAAGTPVAPAAQCTSWSTYGHPANCPQLELVWRDKGAATQFDIILLLGVLILAFWYWVVHYTYDVPKFKRRQREWEDED